MEDCFKWRDYSLTLEGFSDVCLRIWDYLVKEIKYDILREMSALASFHLLVIPLHRSMSNNILILTLFS